MANLQLHIPLASIDAVVVSHSHPDHWSDLEGLYVAMRYFLERRGLPIYAPEGLRDLMRGENRDGTLDWRVIGDGDSAQVGPAEVDTGRRPITRWKRWHQGSTSVAGRSATQQTPARHGQLSAAG